MVVTSAWSAFVGNRFINLFSPDFCAAIGGERSLSKAHVRGREPAPTQTTLHEEYRSTCGSTLIGAGARLASSAP